MFRQSTVLSLFWPNFLHRRQNFEKIGQKGVFRHFLENFERKISIYWRAPPLALPPPPPPPPLALPPRAPPLALPLKISIYWRRRRLWKKIKVGRAKLDFLKVPLCRQGVEYLRKRNVRHPPPPLNPPLITIYIYWLSETKNVRTAFLMLDTIMSNVIQTLGST